MKMMKNYRNSWKRNILVFWENIGKNPEKSEDTVKICYEENVNIILIIFFWKFE